HQRTDFRPELRLHFKFYTTTAQRPAFKFRPRLKARYRDGALRLQAEVKLFGVLSSRFFAALAIRGKRPVQSCPLQVKSRTPAPSRRTSIRKPSCLISCSHPAPAGGFSAGLGRHGSQKSGKATRRNNMGYK